MSKQIIKLENGNYEITESSVSKKIVNLEILKIQKASYEKILLDINTQISELESI